MNRYEPPSESKTKPDIRFHYRLIAGALAIRSANLLPNESEELADVLNRAGFWVKDRDEITGNKYFQLINQRCERTVIGRKAIAKRWFVDEVGPWSREQQVAFEAMDKELGIDTP